MRNSQLVQVGDQWIFDFPGDDRNEYFRLLQLAPWSDTDAKRLAELQPLEDAHVARWKAILAQQVEDPASVRAGAVSEAQERDPSWGCEWRALDSKWRRKTAEGRAAAEQEWETLRRTKFSLPR